MTSSPQAPALWTTLAILLRPQGRKGEVLADLLTDFPERFDDRSLFLARPAADGVFRGAEAQARAITVTGHWLPVGRNHGRIVLTIAGIDSISKAEELAGLAVVVPATERVELEEDAEYVSDLLDCVVFDGTQRVGVVTGVEFPSTPDGNRRLPGAAPLLTVETEAGDEVLIPYVKSFLIALSPGTKRIDMQLPAGLVELNRPASGAKSDDPAGDDADRD